MKRGTASTQTKDENKAMPQRSTTVSCHIDGLVQERRNSSALAMELRLSWTNPIDMESF